MNNVTYFRADSVAAAIRNQTTTADAQFIAGGTNLIDLMKENVARPAHLVGINRLPLTTIDETPEGGLRLGALMTNADTAYHPLVQQRYPLLAQTILAGASAQLRNMATNGGNLMQRTRCYYFYDTATPCNKRNQTNAGVPGCGAIGGYNRIHAILGTGAEDGGESTCIATYPSDMAVALAALRATVRVSGPAGERAIPMSDFHRLPGNEPWRDNTLQVGELITAIELPPKGFAQHYTYLKVRDRTSYAFALVSVAVGLEVDNAGIIREARMALGGVAHKPWVDAVAEALLVGQPATTTTFQRAAEQVVAGARGYGPNDFKIELARRSIVRALQEATHTDQP